MNSIRFLVGIASLSFVLGALLGLMFGSSFRRRTPGAGLAMFRTLLVVSLVPWLIHAWYTLGQHPAGAKLISTFSFSGVPGAVIAFVSTTVIVGLILLVLALWLSGRLAFLSAFLPIVVFAVHYVFAVPFLSATGMDLNLRALDPLGLWLAMACLGLFALLFMFAIIGLTRRTSSGGSASAGTPKGKMSAPADDRRPADITAELARMSNFKQP